MTPIPTAERDPLMPSRPHSRPRSRAVSGPTPLATLATLLGILLGPLLGTGPATVLAAVFGASLVTGAVPAAEAASFDCRRAVTRAEHDICDTPALSSMDETLARYYRALVGGPFHDETCRDRTRAAQRAWLAERDRCGDVGCLAARYAARIDALRGAWIDGCATP